MATKKPRKPTPNQAEWLKELKRLKRFIKNAEKRGYIFDASVIPEQPDRVTKKHLLQIKSLKPNVLYQHAEYVDKSTGEVMPATEGRKLERKASAEKAKETRARKKRGIGQTGGKSTATPQPNVPTYIPSFAEITIANYKATLRSFPTAEGSRILEGWIDRLVADNGVEAVAQMLQDGAEAGYTLDYRIVYKSANTYDYMYNMMNYLQDQGSIYRDEILDLMQELEYSEDWEQPR